MMTYTNMVFDDLPYGSDYYSDDAIYESDEFPDDGSVMSDHSSTLSKHSDGKWGGSGNGAAPESDEDRAFDERIRRLTKLPNVWCPKRGTFVFPDQPISSDSSTEESSGDSDCGASSRWAVLEPAAGNDSISLNEIIEQQKVEQKEEEERQAFLREQARLREKERARQMRNWNELDRRSHGRGGRGSRGGHGDRPHHAPHVRENERRRHGHDGRPPYQERDAERRRRDGRGPSSHQNRSHPERDDHSAASRNGPRRPSLLVSPTATNTTRQQKTDSEGFVMVSYTKQKRNDSGNDSGRPTPRSGTTQQASEMAHERNGEVLCPHPFGHDSHCRLVHRIRDWQPRRCKNPSNCSRGESCAFWHTQNETREAYLTRAIRHNVSFFRKQRVNYISTYKLRC